MNTLAIDTSLAIGSVAALSATEVADAPLAAGEHARLLAPALVEVAARLGWSIRDAELVAVVRGPGSFTGLRVGVATAKAVAWAAGARLVGVSACDVVARLTARALAGCTGPLAIAFDAGRGDVFAADAAPDAASPTGWTVAPGALRPWHEWLAALPPGTCISGPALTRLEGAAPPGIVIAPRAAWFPTAAAAGGAARALAAAGRFDDPSSLVPHYIRPSYADEKPRA